MEKIEVPQTLNEAVIDRWYVRDHEGKIVEDEALASVQSGLRRARIVAEQLASAATVMKADGSMSAAAKALVLRKRALDLGEQTCEQIDAARKSVEAEIEALENEMQPQEPASEPDLRLESDIRTRLAALPRDERNAVIADALAHDDRVMAAILRAPAFVLNMGKEELASTKFTWQKKRFPAERDRADRLSKALQISDLLTRSFVHFVASCAESDFAIATEAAAEKTRAALEELNSGDAA